jgi:hypothetical protein
VGSVSGTRTLENCGHTQLLAGVEECARIVGPRSLVEIHGEKPAGFVVEKRINANGLFPEEMALDDRVGQWEELSGVLVDLLPILGPACVDRFPIFQSGRRVAMPAVGILPSPRLDILSSTKQAPE